MDEQKLTDEDIARRDEEPEVEGHMIRDPNLVARGGVDVAREPEGIARDFPIARDGADIAR